ncbi:MAG: VanZ family protein [Solobacterium sp.]|jgi:glycopeptide antibiotics resistance protein|nr:VanZ family protein [Solobacterium sp.]MCH4204780.1 VanZ family protein [Solobacterium sp.]MCH4226404.1 VanZ family protein [Solobacterium sp.]MCH4282394.1 VanZ family protein [Solobacterium sp.]
MDLLLYIPDIAAMAAIYILFLHQHWSKCRPGAHFLFYLCTCFIFLVTLSPFIMDIPHLFSGMVSRYNFDPFVDLLNGYGSPLQECIENIVLFIPFAFACRMSEKTSLWKTLLLGILYSLLIETVQPLISTIRVFDITDIITNACGALIGAFLYSLYIRLFPGKEA